MSQYLYIGLPEPAKNEIRFNNQITIDFKIVQTLKKSERVYIKEVINGLIGNSVLVNESYTRHRATEGSSVTEEIIKAQIHSS